MTLYLNTKRQYENYKELSQEKYFVDKSEIISIINENISTKSKYICVTRPRRFGKSSVADMLGAYYSKVVDSKVIFDKLKISKNDDYLEKLNKYNVISISFAEIDSNCSNCVEYIDRISNLLREDLKDFYIIQIKKTFVILRKPALISHIQTSLKRYSNLSTMSMTTYHQVYIPYF